MNGFLAILKQVTKRIFGLLSLAKFDCVGLLASLSHSFSNLLFCYTLSQIRRTQYSYIHNPAKHSNWLKNTIRTFYNVRLPVT